jgi:hypothetical protein
MKDNFVQGTAEVLPNAVLEAAITPSTRTASVDEVVSYTLSLNSRGPRATPAVSVSNGIGGTYFRYDVATTSRGTCGLGNLGLGFYCDIGDIPAGELVTIQLQGHAIQGETMTVGANISAGAYMSNPYPAAQLVAIATRDVGIDLGSTYRVLPVGVATDLTFPVHAYGTLPIENVRVRFYPSNASGEIKAVELDGVPCTRPTNTYECAAGTMSPGETRMLRVKVRFDATPQIPANSYLEVSGDGDQLFANNQGNVILTARAAVDVAISNLTGGTVFEGQLTRIGATLSSAGIDPANDVRVAFEVPAPLEIRAGTWQQGTCTVESARKASCARASMAAGSESTLYFDVTSTEPGTFTGHLTATADNDGIPENNVFDIALLFRPLTDVGIRPIPKPPDFVFGRSYTLSFEVFTGGRPVPYVDVSPPTFGQHMIIDSVSTTLGSCPWPMTSAYTCHLGAMAANATATITMTLHPAGLGFGGGGSSPASASTSIDSDFSNNSQWVDWQVYPAGDVAARVASPSSSGRDGERLVLPKISLATLVHSEKGTLEIPLPPFAVLESVASPTGMCSGTSTLKCYFFSRDAGMTDDVEVTLRLNGTGTFTSNIIGTAANDDNAANNSVSMIITATPAAASSSSGGGSSSSGGGGGRLEWSLLAALSLVTLWRQRRRAIATVH